MKSVLAAAVLTAVAGQAQAAEGRLGAGVTLSHVAITDDDGNELSWDQRSVAVSGIFFVDEAGPFLGASLSKERISNVEFNDVDLGSGDADGRALTLGYRTGATGETQWLLAVSRLQLESDGDSANATRLALGLERLFGETRVNVTGNYLDADQEFSVGLDLGATFFVTPELGFSLGAGYSSGQIDDDGFTLDTADFHVGGGLELRFLSKK